MLRVVTYNFYCRPRFTFFDNQITRAKLLASELINFEKKDGKKIDVICFQEIVDNKVHKILKKELKKIGFLFKTKRTSIKKTFTGMKFCRMQRLRRNISLISLCGPADMVAINGGIVLK